MALAELPGSIGFRCVDQHPFLKALETTDQPWSADCFLIINDRSDDLVKRVAKLSKKAARTLEHPITATPIMADLWRDYQNFNAVTGKPFGPTYRFGYTIWRVTGLEQIKHNGWSFAGTLQHLDTGDVIVRSVPGVELPERFRETPDTTCDHCHRNQRRVDTYVVSHEDGRYAVLGSTCVQEFLGFDPTLSIEALQMQYRLTDASAPDFSTAQPDVLMVEYLAHVSAAMRANGWTPRNSTSWATADQAMHSLENPGGCELKVKFDSCDYHYEPSAADISLAEQTIAWVRTDMAAKTNQSDYEHNVVVALKSDVVHARTTGIVASAVRCFQRELDFRAKRAAEQAARADTRPSEYLGQVSERITLTATVRRFRDITSDWGTSRMYELVDDQGNIAVWFCSTLNVDFALGEKVTLAGTIKKLGEFQGQRQTTITRCKVK